MSTIPMPDRVREPDWRYHVQFRQLQSNDGKGRVKHRQGYADQEYLTKRAHVAGFLSDVVAEVGNVRWSYRVSITMRGQRARVKVFRNRQPGAVVAWAKEVVA